MMAWKYSLPAFFVPSMFTFHPDGVGLLPKGSWRKSIWTTPTAAVGRCAWVAGFTGWFKTQTTLIERLLVIVAGLVLVYPSLLEDMLGIALFSGTALLQFRRRDAPGG
jgi:TRAP-type uncharacterized transport system fused permease subunit